MRSYASLGSFDFIAFKRADCQSSWRHTDMILIQVKGDPYGFPEEAKQLLLEDSEKAGARPVLVYRETRKKKLGLTKKGRQRTQAKWETVYL